jgi:hypothetical protein
MLSITTLIESGPTFSLATFHTYKDSSAIQHNSTHIQHST